MATVATVTIAESTGATPTVTNSVTNLNMGSVDAVNLAYASNPIVAGNNGYEKWVRIYLSATGTSNTIDNFQVWMTPAPSVTGITYYGNVTSTGPGGTNQSFAQPTTANSTVATISIPTADPGSNNLAPSAGLSTAGSYSEYCVLQVRSTASSPPGNLPQKTFHFQYDEQ
jgi:hypothetical protein